MILRRLTTALRKQDWFTVVIETLIVVFGVYLGIQLGNWNEARNASAGEARIIERLTSDFERQEATLLERIDATRSMLNSVNELIVLISAETEPEDMAHVRAMIVDIFGVSVREAPPASYEELVASGGFAQLSDIPLRDALAGYGLTNALWDYVELRSQALKDPDSPLVQSLGLKPGFIAAGSTPDGIVVDWEKFREAGPALLLVVVNLSQALDRHQKDLAAVRGVLDALEAAR